MWAFLILSQSTFIRKDPPEGPNSDANVMGQVRMEPFCIRQNPSFPAPFEFAHYKCWNRCEAYAWRQAWHNSYSDGCLIDLHAAVVILASFDDTGLCHLRLYSKLRRRKSLKRPTRVKLQRLSPVGSYSDGTSCEWRKMLLKIVRFESIRLGQWNYPKPLSHQDYFDFWDALRIWEGGHVELSGLHR